MRRSNSPRLDFSPPRVMAGGDWRAGFASIPEERLRETGLRGRQLGVVVGVLGVLGLLAALTLLANILIIVYLGMGPKGIGSLQLLRGDDGGSVVRFLAPNIHLHTVTANSGIVGGHSNASLNADAPRIIMGQRGKEGGAQLILEQGRIRAEGVKDLLIVETGTRRPLFSANHPRFHLRNGTIKQISAKQIITNIVKAPVDKGLRFEVDNLSFRGNEGNRFKSKTLRMSAQNDITFRTSENGNIRLSGEGGVMLSEASRFPLSSSPRLSASVLGYRLCVCGDSARIFVVPGNKACTLEPAFCP